MNTTHWYLKPVTSALVLAGVCAFPLPAFADTPNPAPNKNPGCGSESVYYNPDRGQDIVVPKGYKVEVWAKDLNFPTDIVFLGDKHNFTAYVLESGTGLPGACNNNNTGAYGGKFAAENPFTPGVLVLNKNGKKIAGPLAKPTASGGGLQPDGPAIGLAFERGLKGGRLFVSDSNQGIRGAPGQGNNTSRIMVLDRSSGAVTPFILGLPTGDHPTEQLLVKGNWIYWSQGSATNSGVTGLDNGAGGNQHEIACQDIKLSQNTFSSVTPNGVVQTSGYSNFGVVRPGAHIPAFEDATKRGMCTGAILRARIDVRNPDDTIEPFSWGYRNPYGIRFAPKDHPLEGKLFVTENGEDERGARPTNNAPDRLQVAQQNKDGTPDYHGWPDRFGFLESTQALFNPLGNGDDPAAAGKPVLPVLAYAPQKITAPLAILPTDVAAVGLDFAPHDFTGRVVKRGAALVSREGDFGFSPKNGTPIEGSRHPAGELPQERAAANLDVALRVQLQAGRSVPQSRRLARMQERPRGSIPQQLAGHQPAHDRGVRSRRRAIPGGLRRGPRRRTERARVEIRRSRQCPARADPGYRRDLAYLPHGEQARRRRP